MNDNYREWMREHDISAMSRLEITLGGKPHVEFLLRGEDEHWASYTTLEEAARWLEPEIWHALLADIELYRDDAVAPRWAGLVAGGAGSSGR